MKKLILILILAIGFIVQGQMFGVVASGQTVSSLELYPQDNAASIDTETNSIGSWNSFGSTVTVESVDFTNGSYSIKNTATSTNGSDRIELSLPAFENGATYTFSWDYKHIAAQPSPNARHSLWSGFSDYNSSDLTSATWATKTETFTSDGTAVIIRMYVVADSHDGNGDVLLIDNFTITKD